MRRRAFALVSGVAGVILFGVGLVLSNEAGVTGVIGLVCLAYGIGSAVAALFVALGQNPLRR